MTILVGYVPTPEGLAAVDYAVGLATLSGERIVVVNSGVRGSDADPGFSQAADWDALDERLSSRGVEHELRQPVGADSPADEILAAATALGADLIVIGLRRRSGVGRLVLGSLSQQIILEADCPVVAVKRAS